MIKLTFLSAANGTPLVKRFDLNEVQSYPNVKNFNSSVVEVDSSLEGMQHFTQILREQAAAGSCLLKGPLTEPLVNDSRAGKSDKDASTRLLVLDIDGVRIDSEVPKVFDADSLRMLDRVVTSQLPGVFESTTHVIQASASLGVKERSVSLHLYYFLDDAVHPRVLKDYLTGLNFDEGFFESNLGLTATGLSLSYGIDRTLADNSRLVYIGHPIFTNVADPFPNPDDRIVLIPGTSQEFPSLEILRSSSAAVTRDQLRVLNRLRVESGLPKKMRIKYEHEIVDGARVTVLADPEPARMLMVADEGDYVRYNLNGGDSCAYWVRKSQPEIVHNFKGDPAFRFIDVDPEGYEEHIARFTELPPEQANADGSSDEEPLDTTVAPLAFIDWHSQPHWGLVEKETDEILRLEPCKREAIRDLYTQYRLEAPETLPVFDYSFRPHDDRLFDREAMFINKYSRPKILRDPPEIPEQFRASKMGYFQAARVLFPTIYKLLYSICGCKEDSDDGIREMEYFINWLAYVVQHRKKALTAWVFHGTQGTGKGLFFDKVLTPMIGEKYAMMKRTQDLDDFFNGYIERTLLIAVDEFRTEGRGVKTDLTNKLKNMITETVGTVRAMRTEQYSVDLYTNFIFFSNDRDAVKIPGDDRRFNVAPRQETTLLARFPGIIAEIEKNIVKERELFAAYLLSYEVNEKYVATPLENDAKKEMREASTSSIDQFVEALVAGNLDYFLTIMDEEPKLYGDDYTAAAQNVVKGFIKHFEPGTQTKLWITDIRPLYNVLVGKQDNMVKLGKTLGHHNLETKRIRKGNMVRSGIEVAWNLVDHDIDFLRETYLDPAERIVQPNDIHRPKPLH